MLRKRKAVVGREWMVPSNVRRGGVFMLECISFNLLEAEDILYLFFL